MKPQAVATDKAPKAVGPYSQAVRAGDFLFCAGQIPLDPATGTLVPGGIREQTARVLDNIKCILASQGLGVEHVVKTTVFMTDLADFAAMNEVYAKCFPTNPPARSTGAGRRPAKGRAGRDRGRRRLLTCLPSLITRRSSR